MLLHYKSLITDWIVLFYNYDGDEFRAITVPQMCTRFGEMVPKNGYYFSREEKDEGKKKQGYLNNFPDFSRKEMKRNKNN